MTQFVLASGSARRALLLQSSGYTFTVDSPDVDESPLPGEDPLTMVERLALEKARHVARRHPGLVVLAADTTVVLDGKSVGKPVDIDDARRMLHSLMGRTHVVATGVAVVTGDSSTGFVDSSTVHMSSLSDDDLEAYLATGESLDKAGAYALQGEARNFIDRIDGLKSTVIGLPLPLVVAALDELGIPRNTM
ncbi:MAG: septum formation protein Maf [Actinobacteria bacterium]|nr:septum formation protein Maf [Actinomycetota bacterium]